MTRQDRIGRRPGVATASAAVGLAVAVGLLANSAEQHVVAMPMAAETVAPPTVRQAKGLGLGVQLVDLNGSLDGWTAANGSQEARRGSPWVPLAAAQQADFSARFGPTAALAISSLDGSPAVSYGGDVGAPYAWSTAKVLAATALLSVSGADQLDATETAALKLALTESDNDALAELTAAVGRRIGDGSAGVLDYLTGLLRSAGDPTTRAEATDDYSLGETVWPLGDQAEFFAAVVRGCVLPPDATSLLLKTMGEVVDEQRWGVGQAGSPAFKGGWDYDDEGKAYVRQVGLLTAADGNQYAVAISVRGASDSDEGESDFDASEATLTAMAQWLQAAVAGVPEATHVCDTDAVVTDSSAVVGGGDLRTLLN